MPRTKEKALAAFGHYAEKGKAPGGATRRSGLQDALGQRKEAFCRHYLAYPVGREAARRAGVPEPSVALMANRWLHDEDVMARIEQLANERHAKLEVNAQDVLRELLGIALADPVEAFDENGALLPIRQIPQGLRRTISSMESEDIIQPGTGKVIGRTKKLKFWDKTRGLEMLARHLALFRDSLTVHQGEQTEVNEVEIGARVSSLVDMLRARAQDASDLLGDVNAIKGEQV
jgi:phage terminase small subunit